MFKNIKDSTLLFLYFVLIPLIPFLFALIWQKQKEEDFIYILINACILYFPLLFIKKHKLYLAVVTPFLFIPALIEFSHIYLYGSRLSLSTFFIIFDSNKSETMEFIQSNFSYMVVFLSVLYSFVVLSFGKSLYNKYEIFTSAKRLKFFILWIMIPFAFKLVSYKGDLGKALAPYVRANHLASMISSYFSYKDQMKEFTHFKNNALSDFKITMLDNLPKKQTHILVVGESTTRKNMSLYGYQRDTTPRLNKLKDELFVFNDVVSSATSTITNLKNIMTLANSENSSSERLRKNIINIYKKAGFKTYWVSNQMILGKWDTITSVFASQANKFNFTNTNEDINYVSSYDEKVLPIFERYLDENVDKKLIIVHLFGTHMGYGKRYPKDFKVFKDNEKLEKKDFHNDKNLEVINDYDNAILYNDYIVSQILEKVINRDEFLTLTYLSDHGDEVYHTKNFHGHPSTTPTKSMFEIPFIMWVSEKFKKQRNIQLNKYLDRKYVTDDFIHTMLDLSGVYPEEFESTKSLVNDNFIEKKRYADSI